MVQWPSMDLNLLYFEKKAFFPPPVQKSSHENLAALSGDVHIG